MAWFTNRRNGRKFQVSADRAHLFEARPGHYAPHELAPEPDPETDHEPDVDGEG